jgi:septal ring factor EnvC (AmiA/AmiB activator)
MKKFLIAFFILGSGITLVAQTASPNEEMTNLKNHVNSIKVSHAKLENRLNGFMKKSKCIQDSLQAQIKASDAKLMSLADSLSASKTELNALNVHVENLEHRLNHAIYFHVIIFILLLAIIAWAYLSLLKKNSKGEIRLLNLKESLELEIKKD